MIAKTTFMNKEQAKIVAVRDDELEAFCAMNLLNKNAPIVKSKAMAPMGVAEVKS